MRAEGKQTGNEERMPIRRRLRAWFFSRKLWFKELPYHIRVEWQGSIPRLILHEKYERHARWSLRAIILVVILSGALTFRPLLFGVLWAAFLVAIQQLIERRVFEFTTIFVQPLPDFDYRLAEWAGMAFMFQPEGHDSTYVGMAFGNADYGARLFSCFRAWNYDLDEDKENNIHLSFILEDDDTYSVYIYPDMNREVIKSVHREVETESNSKVHRGLVLQLVFCKEFPRGEGSTFDAWWERYKIGEPFYFVAFTLDEQNQAKPLTSVKPVLKHHVKILRRADLIPADIERDHGRCIMGR